mmetsp:Transcript_65432/g.149978  ORF Transcript_65432/g.149978 Transcript_65432/m.149978 type:complete len:328 (-) Transcript_65432:1018-2001(-)
MPGLVRSVGCRHLFGASLCGLGPWRIHLEPRCRVHSTVFPCRWALSLCIELGRGRLIPHTVILPAPNLRPHTRRVSMPRPPRPPAVALPCKSSAVSIQTIEVLTNHGHLGVSVPGIPRLSVPPSPGGFSHQAVLGLALARGAGVLAVDLTLLAEELARSRKTGSFAPPGAARKTAPLPPIGLRHPRHRLPTPPGRLQLPPSPIVLPGVPARRAVRAGVGLWTVVPLTSVVVRASPPVCFAAVVRAAPPVRVRAGGLRTVRPSGGLTVVLPPVGGRVARVAPMGRRVGAQATPRGVAVARSVQRVARVPRPRPGVVGTLAVKRRLLRS